MTCQEFIAGPLHIDGHTLNFFVDLTRPNAYREVLAATYTLLIMKEQCAQLIFEEYAHQHIRRTEDDWYAKAQSLFNIHLEAILADPIILKDVQSVVTQQYFNNKVPVGLQHSLNKSLPQYGAVN